ncbi:hypothetical protein ACBI99_13425 [Nonomuraea sp. ATR24]|uniref:hypothetical protein n=1 Tax=Nonomuraea sp. ATR24 TaxID=1676744 RepID=UPI0035C192CF
MRGQGPGSEHERGEADSATAPSTPPPSFGHQPPPGEPPSGHRAAPYAPPPPDHGPGSGEPPASPYAGTAPGSGEQAASPYAGSGEHGGEQQPPAVYPEPTAEEAEGWLSVEGEPPAREGWPAPGDTPPAEAWLSVADTPPVEGDTRPAMAWPPAGLPPHAAVPWTPPQPQVPPPWPTPAGDAPPTPPWPSHAEPPHGEPPHAEAPPTRPWPAQGDAPSPMPWPPTTEATPAAPWATPQDDGATRPGTAWPPAQPVNQWHNPDQAQSQQPGPTYENQPPSGPTYGNQPSPPPPGPAYENEPHPGPTYGYPQAGHTYEDDPHRRAADEAPGTAGQWHPPADGQGGGMSALPAFPGAQPWEVNDGDAAPYDWFADPENAEAAAAQGWTAEAAAAQGWTADPAAPGGPQWEPPPAFTAAAAGMQVWPAPVADPVAMPPWPAATGELEAEADDVPHPTAPGQAQQPSGYAAEPTGSAQHHPDDRAHPAPEPATGAHQPPAAPAPQPTAEHPATAPDHPNGPAHPGAPGQPTAHAPAPHGQAPHGQAPHAPAPHAPAPHGKPTHAPAPHGQPDGRGEAVTSGHPDAHGQPPTHGQPTGPVQPAAGQPTEPALPAAASPQPAPDQGTHDQTGHDQNGRGQVAPPPFTTGDTAPPPAGRKAGGVPVPMPGVKQPPAPLFDPSTQRQPEPGDVPVWPPNEDPAAKGPELPFSPEVWGNRHQGPGNSLPALAPEAFRQPPFAPMPPVKQPGKSKRALFATLGVLVLAGVATGGFFAVRSVRSPTPEAASQPSVQPPTPTSAPPASTPQEPAGASILNSEITDPKKLSLAEAFPEKKVSAAGASFTRVKSDLAAKCDEAAAGPFAEALREHKCSRVLRATYVDSKRRYAVTTGIAVLPSKDAALKADRAKNLSRNVWFRALPGAAGSGGDRVHIAGGYAAGLVWGRYIVFSYATHADGHTPEAKEKTLIKVSSAFRDETAEVLERRINQN